MQWSQTFPNNIQKNKIWNQMVTHFKPMFVWDVEAYILYVFHLTQVNHYIAPFFSTACHAVSFSMHAQASTSRTVGFQCCIHASQFFPGVYMNNMNTTYADLCSTYGLKGCRAKCPSLKWGFSMESKMLWWVHRLQSEDYMFDLVCT